MALLIRKRKSAAPDASTPTEHEAGAVDTPASDRLRHLGPLLGRIALWALIIFLPIRGALAIIGPSSSAQIATLRAQVAQVQRTAGAWPSESAKSFAMQFARAYETWGSYTSSDQQSAIIAPYLAQSLQGAATTPETLPSTPGTAQTYLDGTVAYSSPLDSTHALVTVLARVLRNTAAQPSQAARSQVVSTYLAIPVGRDAAGNLAVYGPPAVVSPVPVGNPSDENVQTLSDPGSSAITTLVSGFLGAYLGGQSSTQLSFYASPGAAISPLNGSYTVQGSPTVQQVGNPSDTSRLVLVSVAAQDSATGAVYTLRYRLGVTLAGGKWLISSISGEPQGSQG